MLAKNNNTHQSTIKFDGMVANHHNSLLCFVFTVTAIHLIGFALACAPLSQHNTTSVAPESSTTAFAESSSLSSSSAATAEPEHHEVRKKRAAKLPFGLDLSDVPVVDVNGVSEGGDEQPLHRRILYSAEAASSQENNKNNSSSSVQEQHHQHQRVRRHSGHSKVGKREESEENGGDDSHQHGGHVENHHRHSNGKRCKHHHRRYHRCHHHHCNTTTTTTATTHTASQTSAAPTAASRSSSITGASSTASTPDRSSSSPSPSSSSQSTRLAFSSPSSSSSLPANIGGKRRKRHVPFPLEHQRQNGNESVLIVLNTTMPFLQGNHSNPFLPPGFSTHNGTETLFVEGANGTLSVQIRFVQPKGQCQTVIAVVQRVLNSTKELESAEVQCEAMKTPANLVKNDDD